MQIDWTILIGCAVILFFPASWLYPAAEKDRLASSHSARFRLERMLGTWQHWFDLVRAFGATYLLVNHAIVLDPALVEEGDHLLELVLTGGILALAILIQTVHYRNFFYFIAPIFFIWGVALAVAGWVPALFAIVFSAVLARLLNHVELKLPLMAGIIGVVGYLVDGLSLKLILTGVLIILPVLIAFCSMQHLVCYAPVLNKE